MIKQPETLLTPEPNGATNPRPFQLPEPIWPIAQLKEAGRYFFQEVVEELHGARVLVRGRGEMLMLSSYSYLGLLRHPEIEQAAKEAIERFSTGVHGVQLLAGTTALHVTLQRTIADFKQAEAAAVFSSGYVTNLATIAALVGPEDYVISDKLNHASIVDGCRFSGAEFLRFSHNDMADLEQRLSSLPANTNKLVVADAVFSMDGDIFDLPAAVEICRRYGAYLMIDEAHSLGVLGPNGRGIEEHFGLAADSIDVKMGTLSKTIPSVGGYIAGSNQLITVLKHNGRGFAYSSALPPAQVAAAQAAFTIMSREPWRAQQLSDKTTYFRRALQQMGFNTLQSQTPIVPVMCGANERAWRMAQRCQAQGLFVQGIPAPVVPSGTARLRCIVTADHTLEDLDTALDVIKTAGKAEGVI